ncbi:MAG: outer membrane protein assembly factor BamE [Methylococcales bacterium]|nr:hypothetical protein [Methylococcaceae bacterium]
MSAAEHQLDLADTHDRAMTLGLVQKQVPVGTSQTQVATVLGSPNIVTRDNNNQETWIYDKIASEASFSQDSGGAQANITGSGGIGGNSGGFGFPGNLSGSLGGNYNKQSGAASITQRTLTVIVKFNEKNVVENVSYHSSKF